MLQVIFATTSGNYVRTRCHYTNADERWTLSTKSCSARVLLRIHLATTVICLFWSTLLEEWSTHWRLTHESRIHFGRFRRENWRCFQIYMDWGTKKSQMNPQIDGKCRKMIPHSRIRDLMVASGLHSSMKASTAEYRVRPIRSRECKNINVY